MGDLVSNNLMKTIIALNVEVLLKQLFTISYTIEGNFFQVKNHHDIYKQWVCFNFMDTVICIINLKITGYTQHTSVLAAIKPWAKYVVFL